MFVCVKEFVAFVLKCFAKNGSKNRTEMNERKKERSKILKKGINEIIHI